MSEYPYEDKIHSKDRVNYKTVKSSDGKIIGKVEAALQNHSLSNPRSKTRR